MATSHGYDEVAIVPRIAVRFPLPLPIPAGFEPARVETWPRVIGRLEYVDGRLLFMPPCGDEQQQTVADVTTELGLWCRSHPDFVVGTNEAGMLLGGEVRAADVAVWRRADLGAPTGGLPRVPPVLAVEVAGRDEGIDALGEKARWYLDRGVAIVWLLSPSERTVRVVRTDGTAAFGAGDRLPAYAELPGLEPPVDDLFRQARR